jgi:hypothetical protein
MISLDKSISPSSNVRRTCYSLLNDPSFEEGESNSGRSVVIRSSNLDELGTRIAQSIKTQGTGELNDGSTSSPVDSCIDNLKFASWDEENWHYTAATYSRNGATEEEIQAQRFERIAMYIIVMDTINFCFWPCTDTEKESLSSATSSTKNLLEYEHLASALKLLAEKDDAVPTRFSQPNCGEITMAEDSYVLAPQNLVNLTSKSFLDMMTPLLPKIEEKDTGNIYTIPNVAERVRLLQEMAQALLTFHKGSATHFISQANRSADLLVHNILQYFPGFRDATVDPEKGRWVAFYKRAQILVADLWAALGSEDGDSKHGADLCNFTDMAKITTFADYRVPQLLRGLSVLEYSPSLSQKVDNGNEVQASSMDELYIRAATVVAVDLLVENVREKVDGSTQNINAVKMDWYLWNIGEKLDREGRLAKHHRVRTIFY